jgi:predicted ester cyclase
MSPEDLRIRARRLVEEVLNQGDLAVADELMTPTCVHHVPGDELAPGPPSLRNWLSRTHRIFPDFHAIVEDEFAAGDQVAQRVTAYGTHQGEFLGVPATGRPVEFSVLQIVRAGPDGRFAEHWCSADLLSALRQLSTEVPALRRVV